MSLELQSPWLANPTRLLTLVIHSTNSLLAGRSASFNNLKAMGVKMFDMSSMCSEQNGV